MDNVYIVITDDKLNYVSSEIDALIKQTKQHDNMCVLSETQFLEHDDCVFKNNVVMVYVSLSDASVARLKSLKCAKALYTIDESKRDGGLFETQLALMDNIDAKTIVTVYPSQTNLEKLASTGHNVVSTYLHASDRKRHDKKIDVIVSGQLDKDYYPVRTQVAAQILSNSMFCHDHVVAYLPHPGFTKKNTKHNIHGETYFNLLDTCRVGVVCKSIKDRLLQKYSEFGASWVLPAGDIPDYAPTEMVRSMIDLSSVDDDKITDTISCVLKHEYDDRVTAYHNAAMEHLESSKCVTKLKQDLLRVI